MLSQLQLCLQAAVMQDNQGIAECLSPSAAQDAGLDPLEAAIDLSESEHSDQGVLLAFVLLLVSAALLPILYRLFFREQQDLC